MKIKFIRKNNLGEEECYIKSLKRYGTKEEMIEDATHNIRPYIEKNLRKQLGYDK
ncbi:MAG TPA: hypothetical protein VIK86_08835 [Candidatus Paceibacterota bacterium]